jgi:ATP-dependent DNA ligase
MKLVMSKLAKVAVTPKPQLQGGKVVDEKLTTWLAPTVVAEVSYAMITRDNMYREPVFVKLVM